MVLWKPHAVSFSSGGVLTIGHFGVLAALLEAEEGQLLSEVREWYGCSGGAITALFGALGVTSTWIRDCAEHINMSVMLSVQEELVVDFLSQWGIDNGSGLVEYLAHLVDTWEPAASTWTFADLVRERPHLHRLGIIATNVSQGKEVLFSNDTTPTMRILDAIRASASIPLVYTPWVDPASGDLFCDGAVLENYPWSVVTDKSRTLVVVCKENQIGRHRNSPPTNIRTLGDYISGILQLRMPVVTDPPRFWIAVNNFHINPVDFHLDKELLHDLIQHGESSANAWVAFRQKAAGSGNPETLPSCAGHCTSACCPPPSEDRMSGIHRSRNLPPTSVRSLDLHTPSLRSVRRWSL